MCYYRKFTNCEKGGPEMRISSFKVPKEGDNAGIKIGMRFNGALNNLNNIVIITGANGSGKSRFLKLLNRSFQNLKNTENSFDSPFKIIENNSDAETDLTPEIAKSFNLVNYSHFDAKLQGPKNFSPYVIHQAKNKLENCNYEETALNSLLFLKDLCEGYSEGSNESNGYKDLMDFIDFAQELELDFSWDQSTKSLTIFDRKFDDANLSPGQLYALRIAVACKAHKASENIAFLLDEPETHLHPSLLIKIINQLMQHFKNAQFFIATHSLPLISYLTVVREDTTVLFMENGEIKDTLRSNSEPILTKLVGAEEEQFAIKQLFVSSEEMACNKFCMECFLKPTVVRGGISGDPSVSIAESAIESNAIREPLVIVDYGAGEGRLLECMLEDNITEGYIYNAYNIDEADANYCKDLIAKKGIIGKSYLNKDNIPELNGKVDCVFMVNVLHEIPPEKWKEEFETISNLLKDDGKLVIIEREILTMGESPFINGFLMLTNLDDESEAAKALFGSDCITFSRHEQKPYIISYTIEKSGVQTATTAKMENVLKHLQENAVKQIRKLKAEKDTISEHKERYKNGMNLAFWLNQLSCATLYLEEFDKNKS